MPPHPHQQQPTKYPPSPPTSPPNQPTPPTIPASKPHSLTNRLYAHTPSLLIHTHNLTPQSQLTDREVHLQEYLSAERATRGNGSPVEGARNVQQVWSFGATDTWPGNVVGDDGWMGGFGDGDGEMGRGMRVVNGDGDGDNESPQCRDRYRRVAGAVDRKHRSLVRRLVGASPPPPRPRRRRSGGAGGVDVKALRQMERNLSALGF